MLQKSFHRRENLTWTTVLKFHEAEVAEDVVVVDVSEVGAVTAVLIARPQRHRRFGIFV
jgi:hypothetical protein